MNFGYCMDCRSWCPEANKREGTCEELYVIDGVLTKAPSSTIGSLVTPSDFGCPYSEEKPKGPFEVCESKYGYYICYKPKARNLGNWTSSDGANSTCKMLNDEWLRRE